MIILPGPASVELGHKIGIALKTKVVDIEFKRFPDGESYIRFTDNVKGEDVVIVQTTSPPQNENLIQLFLVTDNAKEMGAKSITAIVPYFAYSRQDSVFRPGEALSVKTIVTLLKTCGVKRIFTVNAHNPSMLKKMPVHVKDLSAISFLAKYFKEKGFKNAFSVSMGKKGLRTAEEANRVLHGGCGFIPTQRDRVTGVVTLEKKPLPVKDRNAIVFDDIISSGGTMIKAVGLLKEQGAREVYAACVHPLFSDDTRDRIMKAGADDVVGTDTVPSLVSKVSVSPLLAEALKKRATKA